MRRKDEFIKEVEKIIEKAEKAIQLDKDINACSYANVGLYKQANKILKLAKKIL